ncbi:MAG: ABC transporter permease [Bacteroidetes bacterium]|uniref:ABC transporter permease n=1 Tax=Candidatus Gallipaludibacter merdavium TaxID=2840839 RepID=A0A9D9HS30_9BACT|nr:ABC transporter permease [Candidatus Gallipaludibacter merdavium]
MSKIGLIIEREYKTRVLKKSFLLLTFLSPILFAALIAVPLWLSELEADTTKEILVIDRSGLYADALPSDDVYHFTFVDTDLQQAKSSYGKLTGILLITGRLDQDGTATVYSENQIDMETKNHIERLLGDYVEQQKINAYNIPDLQKILEDTQTRITVSTIRWDEKGEEQKGSSELALIIGMVTAMIIYMFIVMYGGQVMSGVVQEKTSRIVEVIVSSVKPFQLMMGKIIGIALVGLTQVFLWVVLTLILSMAATTIMGIEPSAAVEIQGVPQESLEQGMGEIYSLLAGFNFVEMLVYFICYFLGGYLLYASLFAAVGSAVENETDTQQFSLPLTIPIIFAIYAAIYSAQNPDGPLAFWCSLIPFTSPVVMMVRLPFGVPFWQVALSIGILVLSFVLTTWMAGKIYRTGILMYGKKVTWAELWKWLKY